MKNNIENLLLLQNIDSLLVSLKQKLSKTEASIAAANQDIVKEKKAFADFEKSLKDKHAQRAALKIERESLDEKVVKYKIQHATLKKNDEYQAMQLTIDRTKEEISNVEERELEILFEIDDMQAELSNKEDLCKSNLLKINAEISSLNANLDALKKEIDTQILNRQHQADSVEESFYKVYERQISNGKKLPVLVEVKDSKCTGCHLKISLSLNHATQDSLKSPVLCEHCGRILYT